MLCGFRTLWQKIIHSEQKDSQFIHPCWRVVSTGHPVQRDWIARVTVPIGQIEACFQICQGIHCNTETPISSQFPWYIWLANFQSYLHRNLTLLSDWSFKTLRTSNCNITLLLCFIQNILWFLVPKAKHLQKGYMSVNLRNDSVCHQRCCSQ